MWLDLRKVAILVIHTSNFQLLGDAAINFIAINTHMLNSSCNLVATIKSIVSYYIVYYYYYYIATIIIGVGNNW